MPARGGADATELGSLQKSYRILEGDMGKYREESDNIQRMQSKAIKKIRAENERLREEVAMASRRGPSGDDVKHMERAEALQNASVMFARKIEMEKRGLGEVEKQARIAQIKVVEMRQRRADVPASVKDDRAVQKQIRILEDRLDKALIKFNGALTHNKMLRENIDNLRRERVVFDNITQKLGRELQSKKEDIARVIEISNISYEARDEALNRVAQLRNISDREHAAFEGEWRELGKMIDQDRKLKERMDGGGDPQRGRMSVSEEASLKKNSTKEKFGNVKEKAALQASMSRVQTFEEAFEQLKAATGISNIDELVQTFIDAEDQNFSLFNYVNELNNEIEKLEEQIVELKKEIDKYKGQGGQNDRQRKKLLKDLEDRLAATEAKAEQYEARSGKSLRTITSLETGIQRLFNRVGCNSSALSEILGSTGVTESNMMQYLGIVEQKTNELLQAFARLETAGARGSATLGTGPTAPAGATSINIEPPLIGEEDESDDDSDDDNERPLTSEELKAKTLRGLAKKDGAGRKGRKKR